MQLGLVETGGFPCAQNNVRKWNSEGLGATLDCSPGPLRFCFGENRRGERIGKKRTRESAA